MNANSSIVTGGFSDPVFGSQALFRALMEGMARPGLIQSVEPTLHPPAPLSVAAAAILLTLCDHDTSVWVSPSLATSSLVGWLGFHTGAAITLERAQAAFALIEHAAALPSFDLFAQGTQDYPDRSTTVILEVSDLADGPKMRLSGPGIRDTCTISASGLPDNFEQLWGANRAVFPRGVDVVLTCGNRLLCLPRTTRITTEGL